MTTKAKLYIAIMTALAAAILAVAASERDPKNLGYFGLLFALAMLGSAMKIRLPGFKTTISTNFVFILIERPNILVQLLRPGTAPRRSPGAANLPQP